MTIIIIINSGAGAVFRGGRSFQIQTGTITNLLVVLGLLFLLCFFVCLCGVFLGVFFWGVWVGVVLIDLNEILFTEDARAHAVGRQREPRLQL